MNCSRSYLALMCVCLVALIANAQSPKSKPQGSNKAGSINKTDATAEANQLKERRTRATYLLISLAADARSFRDLALRTRALTRIADVLWELDPDQGRGLFLKAWEAADTAEKDGNDSLKLREEVLRLVAKRDRALAQRFLQDLDKDAEQKNTETSETSLWRLPEAMENRLRLATNLLKAGDTKRSLEFAEPVLGTVTISTLEFLTLLREQDAANADRFYAAMLANTTRDLTADANTISLLSSYLFTPHMYVTFTNDGRAETSWMPTSSPPPNVNPQLQLNFFEAAATVLVQRASLPEQDQHATGIGERYMVNRRLLPLFEQYAPPALTDALRGQVEAVAALVSDDLRKGDNEWIRKRISPDSQPAEREQSLLDEIDRAKTSTERDSLYLKLALIAVDKDDLTARDYVSKIEDSGSRKRAEAWVHWSLALKAIQKKRVDLALELAKSQELAHIQRVWIYTQAAKLLASNDREKALSLLNEASIEVGRIDNSDLDRPRGLLAIANAFTLIDPARAWEVTFEAIKAANSTEGFTGEDAALTLTLNNATQIFRKTEAVPDFDVQGIFTKLAVSDFERTVQLARAFQAEAPRANATIVIARTVLETKRNSSMALHATGTN